MPETRDTAMAAGTVKKRRKWLEKLLSSRPKRSLKSPWNHLVTVIACAMASAIGTVLMAAVQPGNPPPSSF